MTKHAPACLGPAFKRIEEPLLQAGALYEEARLEGLRQEEAGEIESRITMHVGAMREDYE